jgi:hypothetical protein
MGSSHFINSTASLWGLDRPEGEDYSVFLGGRQRGDGNQKTCMIQRMKIGDSTLCPMHSAIFRWS